MLFHNFQIIHISICLTFYFEFYLCSNMAGDVEQLNNLDTFELLDDDSSFATIPNTYPRRHPFTHMEHRLRNSPHDHGNHRRYNTYSQGCKRKGHGCDLMTNHSHGHISDLPLHKSHKKDSFGNHIFHKHFTGAVNVSPSPDVYAPYETYHYPGFPFKDIKDKQNSSDNSKKPKDNSFSYLFH